MRALEQLREPLLSFLDRFAPEIPAFQPEEIERAKDGAGGALAGEGGHEIETRVRGDWDATLCRLPLV